MTSYGAEWNAKLLLVCLLIHLNVCAAHKRLGEEGLFKVVDTSVALPALKQRMTIIYKHTLAWGASRNAARQRFRRNSPKQEAVGTLLARLMPPRNAEKSVVVFGNFFGCGGVMAAPVRTLRRALAKRTRVLRIDEHRTSSVCNQCEGETSKENAHPRHTRQLSVYKWKKRLLACACMEHPTAWPRSVHKDDMKDLRRVTPDRPSDKLRVVCRDEKDIMETSLSLAKARAKRSTTQPKNGMYARETCRSWWAREVNAAANMLWAFCTLTKTGERPEPLRRKRKVSSSKHKPAA